MMADRKGTKLNDGEYTAAETARRRDEALKRALAMPPQPFTPKATKQNRKKRIKR